MHDQTDLVELRKIRGAYRHLGSKRKGRLLTGIGAYGVRDLKERDLKRNSFSPLDLAAECGLAGASLRRACAAPNPLFRMRHLRLTVRGSIHVNTKKEMFVGSSK